MTDNLQTKTGLGVSAGSALLFAVVPKCPICLAAYSAFFAAIGVNASVLYGIRIILSALLVGSIGWLFLGAVQKGNLLQAFSLVIGAGLVLSGWIVTTPAIFKIASVVLLTAVSFWAVRSRKRFPSSHKAASCSQEC